MEPSAPAPWRVLEAPAAADEPPSSTSPSSQRPAGATDSPSILPRVLVIVGLALACAAGALLLAVGGGGGAVDIDGGTRIEDIVSTSPGASFGAEAAVAGGDLIVEIVGAVRSPGVYRLPAGSRVGDLLEAAGGYGPRVDTAEAEHQLNLAASLQDGVQIRVPSRDDPPGTAPESSGAGGSPGATSAVDLNRATQAELEALPGIGQATAQKIIGAREEAPFTAIEELRSRGILGEKTFEKLRDLVMVG
jgi:competence protein ComEA